MNNDLISRGDVLDLLNDLANDFGDNYELYSELFDSVCEMESPENIITECCVNCEYENTFEWDVGKYGLKAYCPHCGSKMMLCGACEINCDWDDETRTCSGEMRKGEANNG